MDYSFRSIGRLVSFLEKLEKDTYPEWPAAFHTQITEQAIEHLLNNYTLSRNSIILDVGCGQGPALKIFTEKGFSPIGITLNDTDLEICRNKGFHVAKMDQSFMVFEDEKFDVVWARHVIEHSIFPYFTLSEFCRVLKRGGLLYLEVPAPETSCVNESNPNHYSVLGYTMWLALHERSGLEIQEGKKYFLKTDNGPEEYWGFYSRKI